MHMVKKSCRSALVALLLLSLSPAAAGNLTQRDDYKSFVDEMVSRHQFNGDLLDRIFRKVNLQPSIIEAITRPAEAKPWYQYRPIFMKQARIRGGVKFWERHADTLRRAEEKYGVPPQIIVAIIGVETRYGRYTGNYRVIDALSTLAFDYPPRSRFFRSELEHYLLMTREEQIDPLKMKGSYAGAMGQPQFIASSFRSYAVDFNGDGHRDLWENEEDVIGSVANYFKRHGWERGAPVTAQVSVTGKGYREILEKGIKPDTELKQFRRHGIEVPKQYPDEMEAALIELETQDSQEYWAGMKNFYVITRYNHSALYAMAVYQLSEAILERYQSRSTAAKDSGN
ncbi:MAG: lytic murein transglycosylase B [Gammaproteobacteria bacterium]|nr:lytic murein transglycosylase B [Gammaproteobacteria bacterium]